MIPSFDIFRLDHQGELRRVYVEDGRGNTRWIHSMEEAKMLLKDLGTGTYSIFSQETGHTLFKVDANGELTEAAGPDDLPL